MKPRTNYVFGRHSLKFAVWTVTMERARTTDAAAIISAQYGGSKIAAYTAVFRFAALGFLRWLLWCLPAISVDETGVGFRFLTFYFNVIRGPHVCSVCGRATIDHNPLARCAKCSRLD